MFGIFSNPEKIASKVYTEAISPTIDIIQRLYERKTTQKDLPYDIWNNMYFVGFFLGLCINVISASQKRPPTAKYRKGYIEPILHFTS